jgi:hypothetical protein
MDTNIVGTDSQYGQQGRRDAHEHELSLSERKARLLRQAEFHRQNIVSAKSAIKQGARPDAIFHNALDHATFALRNRVDMVLRPTGTNVATLAPYALSLLTFLRQRRMLKPALGVMAAAAGVALYVKHRRNQQLPH